MARWPSGPRRVTQAKACLMLQVSHLRMQAGVRIPFLSIFFPRRLALAGFRPKVKTRKSTSRFIDIHRPGLRLNLVDWLDGLDELSQLALQVDVEHRENVTPPSLTYLEIYGVCTRTWSSRPTSSHRAVHHGCPPTFGQY